MNITIDITKCTGCGECVENCPMEGFELREVDGREVAHYVIDPDECIDCGACEAGCESGAITIA